jgi:hypothetical protein
MSQFFYCQGVSDFLEQDESNIFGEIAKNDVYDSVKNQKDAWSHQIEILKRELIGFSKGDIIFEYSIPRVGGRIDNVLLYKGIVFVIEFKNFAKEYPTSAIVQTRSYALDLSSFHEESCNRIIVPILVATAASTIIPTIKSYRKNVLDVILSNGTDLGKIISDISNKYSDDNIHAAKWIASRYKPTPTIIEAAEELYKNHSVQNITQNDAAGNLDLTAKAVSKIIEKSKINKEKSICFITGVPGAGKTLAGLNIAIENQKKSGDDYACFLTGNQPLVDVLTEALARDEQDRRGTKISEVREKIKSFIQIIHRFRDDALKDMNKPPVDHVIIFDEAQRAWHSSRLSRFMVDKKKEVLKQLSDKDKNHVLSMSEPEILIDYLNRHQDWAVIICLVGGGQDINDGEAGISEWFNSLKRSYFNWSVYVSDKIIGSEYVYESTLKTIKYNYVSDLHLSVSLRSFRSEKVSEFVCALLDVNIEKTKELYKEIEPVYQIAITRNLIKAKDWVKERTGKTNARYGLMASSKAKRLRTDGIWVECSSTPIKWFLSDENDIKSSFALEETATEFDVQGLEIDWGIVGWDADYRYSNGQFSYYHVKGSKWQNTKDEHDRRYTKNAYRVLLTRSRQGFVIFVPRGDKTDKTRQPQFYDELYDYLKEIGISEI